MNQVHVPPDVDQKVLIPNFLLPPFSFLTSLSDLDILLNFTYSIHSVFSFSPFSSANSTFNQLIQSLQLIDSSMARSRSGSVSNDLLSDTVLLYGKRKCSDLTVSAPQSVFFSH